MNAAGQQGLSRRELERELRWLMHKAPKDPTKLAEFLGQVVVTLIDKNNAALARSAQEARDQAGGDPEEDF
jgi:hypothetical protein